MKKSNLVKLVGLVTTLSITACMSGCGKQEEVVNETAVEETTLENESESTEESLSVATEEETESIEETTIDEAETESVAVQDYTITEMNVEMQATQNAVTYETPSADTVVGGVKQDEIVKVTGIVDDSDWYRIEQTDNTISFIESAYLKEIETQQADQQQAQNNSNTQDNSNQDQNKQQPQVQTPPKTDPTPQPPVDPPAETQDPPAVDIGYGTTAGGGTILPDGGVRWPDGTEVHPGDRLTGVTIGGIGTHGLY